VPLNASPPRRKSKIGLQLRRGGLLIALSAPRRADE